ncbi:MAG TPA: LacI family DNA-binding transcriptional regulator [Propionibacteriaceae bacterium]
MARRAGVSSAVVSYVVNGGPRRVAPETADRVRSAIDALQYRPNANARALRSGSTKMLGLVLPDISNPYFAEFALAVEVAAAAEGYMLVVANSHANGTAERRIVDDLAGQHVDGLMLCSVMTSTDYQGRDSVAGPTVLVNCSEPFPGQVAIGPGSEEGCRQAVDHLISVHDHQFVALIMGASGGPIPEPREQGWSEAFRAHGLPPGPILRTSFSRRGGYDAAQIALGWNPRPTAMFVASDQQASGVLTALREHDVRCPQDLAVISFDGTSEAAYSAPPLTVVQQPVEAMARAAVAAVLDLASGTVPDAYQQFSTELVIRSSCGCSPPVTTPTS